jgi:hypothetical protein
MRHDPNAARPTQRCKIKRVAHAPSARVHSAAGQEVRRCRPRATQKNTPERAQSFHQVPTGTPATSRSGCGMSLARALQVATVRELAARRVGL